MPAPSNTAEFVELVQKSGLVEEAQLRAYLKQLAESPTGMPPDPARLAGVMVRDGILTYFQAEQILQGKYKRFTIGKYKVLERLGAGGMGQVYLCEHLLMRRRAAIKVLPTSKSQDPASLERFYREARAIAAVDHPNIVRAYDIDQADNLHFLVMEYVDGVSLQELVKKIGPLPYLRACHYIYGAAVGLQHVHEIGLVHRDIKPGNILVDRSGVVKILDLGLARFFHETDELTKKYDENILGTADYLSPEQAVDSHQVDIRTDIYSLGATFYYLLAGHPPFPDGTVTQKLIWHQYRDPKPIQEIRSDVPAEICAIIAKMMQKSPDKRYQTPAEVMSALAPWVTTPIPPPAEHELPQLSRAAGGRQTARAPVTATPIALPGGPTADDSPSTSANALSPPTDEGAGLQLPSTVPIPPVAPIESASATPPQIIPVITPPAATVWEQLAHTSEPSAEAQPVQPPSTRRRKAAPSGVAKHKVLTGAGVILAVAAIGIGMWTWISRMPRLPDKPPPTDDQLSHVLRVSRSAGSAAFATLREALSKAKPGDTIVIGEPELTESPLRLDRQRHKNLTIEGDKALPQPPVIRPAGTQPFLLEINGLEGVTIRHIHFDGNGQVDDVVRISGITSGLRLLDYTLQGGNSAQIRLSNAAGDSDQPMIIDGCRIVITTPAAPKTTTCGVAIVGRNAESRHIHIRNLRMESKAGGVGIRVEGPTYDIPITQSRFFQLDTAIECVPTPGKNRHAGTFRENTVAQCKTGLRFHLPKADPPSCNWEVSNNYFAQVGRIGESVGGGRITGLNVQDNLATPDCGKGNLNWPIATSPNPPVMKTDPADDATFLRFPSGRPQLPNGHPVGAP